MRHVGPKHTNSSLSPHSSIRPFAHPSSVVTQDHYQGCPLHCLFGASEEARPRAQRGGQGRGRGGEGREERPLLRKDEQRLTVADNDDDDTKSREEARAGRVNADSKTAVVCYLPSS